LIDTKRHCAKLLEAVEVAGEDPALSYQARNRLRRALIALERGPRGMPHGEQAPAEQSAELRLRAQSLMRRATHLCQPSESLDDRWRREWSEVRAEVLVLRQLLETGPHVSREP